VLLVQSDGIVPQATVNGPRKLLRTLKTEGQDSLFIWEETGESIARHIWDAGLVLSAFIQTLNKVGNKGYGQTKHLPQLQALLSKPGLKVLELGAGCGIVGIAFAKSFPDAKLMLTDLPEAEEIARYNIAASTASAKNSGSPNLSYQNLDWAEPLPTSLEAEAIDLVLVADCTYNPDVVPHLVSTLSSIVHSKSESDSGRRTLVLLAMKVRHDTERIFFDLMEASHMRVVDSLVLPLPHLGEEEQEIEIYLFSGDELTAP